MFGNLRTHCDGPGEHLKRVAKENQILENIYYKYENTAVTFEIYVTRIKEAYKILKDNGEVHNDSQKVQKSIREILSDTPDYLHAVGGIVHMDTDLNNYFNLEVDGLSQYVSTISPNVDLVRGTRGTGGRNVSSFTCGGRGGGRGGVRFGGRGGGRFGYGQGRSGRGRRGGCDGRGGRGGVLGGIVNHNSYNNN